MKKINKTPLAAAVGTAVVSAFTATVANADANPFAMTELSEGYMQVAEANYSVKPWGGKKANEASCGEGKCGEGKCGGKAKAAEAKCGEAKCGSMMEDGKMKKGMESACGAMMKGKEGACGMKKATEGKCGEGKCGEGKCGGKAKTAEAKCGEAKCGSMMEDEKTNKRNMKSPS